MRKGLGKDIENYLAPAGKYKKRVSKKVKNFEF